MSEPTIGKLYSYIPRHYWSFVDRVVLEVGNEYKINKRDALRYLFYSKKHMFNERERKHVGQIVRHATLRYKFELGV